MANTKQAKKMVRKTVRQTRYNRMWKSKVKTAIKNLDALVTQSSSSEADISNGLKLLQKTVDKAAKSRVIHKNKANRIKSRQVAKIKNVKGVVKPAHKTTEKA